ncbi:MAG: OmpH family outer membrane protein [Bryobacteraceae bacterium]
MSLATGAAFLAHGQSSAPGKVGIIHVQQAIVNTKDGKKAFGDLQSRFEPRSKDLEAKKNAIAALQQELSKGSNTMAEERRATIQREIDSKTKSLNRQAEDAQTEWEQEQNKLINELGQRLIVVLEKYARENGYSMVLDVSSQQSPVLWVADGIDITKEIVDLYDKNAPAAAPVKPGGAPAAFPAKPPLSPQVKPAAKQPGTVK